METRTPAFVSKEAVSQVPKSNWYKYTLYCGHEVYTRVRLTFRVSFNQHFIQCPQHHEPALPTKWVPVEKMEAVNNEHVSHVHDGSYFILPKRILRTDGDNRPSGNPFPYTSSERDY